MVHADAAMHALLDAMHDIYEYIYIYQKKKNAL